MPNDLNREDSPILSTQNCTCAALRAAGRAVVQFYDGALADCGITINQFALLATLQSVGPVTMTKLATAMATDRTTLTRTLRPLEREGLIETSRGSDRRRRMISITERGETVLERARPHWTRAQKHIVERLGTADWADLMNKLKTTVDATR